MTSPAIDTGEHEWGIDSTVTSLFDFDYEAGRDQLLRLYDKGTHKREVEFPSEFALTTASDQGVTWSVNSSLKPTGARAHRPAIAKHDYVR
jgi:hypothetical protein